MKGAFQTSRELFANPIWKNIVEFRLFFLIYGNAVYSKDGVRMSDDLLLKRGEWCRSTRKLQEDLQYIENRQVKTYSTSVINRCIKKLERDGRLQTRIHDLGTIFTVINYDEYQFSGQKPLQDESSNHASYKQGGCAKTNEHGTDEEIKEPLPEIGFDGIKGDNLEHNLEQRWNSVGTVLEQQRNNNKNVKNDKNVIINLSAEIKNFRSLYSPDLLALIDKYLDFIRETRKSKKIADSIILKIMTYFGKYSAVRVEHAIRAHMNNIEKKSAPEEYTFGIIRNTTEEDARRKLHGMQQGGQSKPKGRLTPEQIRALEEGV